MNEVVKHHTTLPANFGANLMRGIADVRSTMMVSDGGKPLLRLLKSGVWVYGQQNEKVVKGTEWGVNIASLARGWVCWGDGELLGQAMASVQSERIPQPAPVQGVPFVEQFSMELVCITEGEAEGLNVIYKNSSIGFKRAFEKLLGEIQQRWSGDKTYFWPIVQLSQEPYDHKKFGQIFNPILTVTGWADEEGNFLPELDDEQALETRKPVASFQPEPEPAEVPVRKRGRPAAVAEEPAPVATAQAHVGQRRRPVAR